MVSLVNLSNSSIMQIPLLDWTKAPGYILISFVYESIYTYAVKPAADIFDPVVYTLLEEIF